MKLIAKLIIPLVIFNLSLKSQSTEWNKQRVNPNYNTHTQILFVNENLGWKTSNGYLQRTNDGGETWEIPDSNFVSIKDIFFLNELVGWIIIPSRSQSSPPINQDIVYKTTDGGQHWTHMNNSIVEMNRLRGLSKSIFFTDSLTGWIVGSKTGDFWSSYRPAFIAKTTTGGKEWIIQDSKVEVALNATSFIDSLLGFAVGEGGTLIQTSDKGENWVKLDVNTNENLLDIFFIDEKNGWTVGTGGVVLHTNDGGENWIFQNSGVQHTISSIHFVNKNKGWATVQPNIGGQQAYFIHTEDGGNTWNLDYLITSEGYNRSVFFINENIGWIMNTNGTVHKTIDAGMNWQLHYGFYPAISKMYALDHKKIFAVGERGAVLCTKNGGNDWTVIETNLINYLKSIHFCDEKVGWIVGPDREVGLTGTILKTSDGGETWVRQTSPQLFDMNSIFAVDSLNAWAVGWGYRILNTNDGGLTWNIQTINNPWQLGGNRYLRSVFFINKSIGWAVGEEGAIIHTLDGGVNWNIQNVERSTVLNDVFFVDDKIGWAVGQDGIVLKTSNGGLDWEAIDLGLSNLANPSLGNSNVFQVKFTNKNHGFISGEFGLLFTEDGGESWLVDTNLGNHIEDVVSIGETHFFDVNNGWIVENIYNIIYYGSQKNQTNVVDKIFSSNSISVYPNPFSSEITIDFFESLSSNTYLKIYDLQGRLLIDEFLMSQGSSTSKYIMDLSQLNSGVYLLQIANNKVLNTLRVVKD
jgi:photosystem II stability/assembly factor-like uncharacterized protein